MNLTDLLKLLAGLPDWFSGKKTYIVAVLTAVVAGLDLVGYSVPAGILVALAAAFGVTIRQAVAKAAQGKVS